MKCLLPPTLYAISHIKWVYLAELQMSVTNVCIVRTAKGVERWIAACRRCVAAGGTDEQKTNIACLACR